MAFIQILILFITIHHKMTNKNILSKNIYVFDPSKLHKFWWEILYQTYWNWTVTEWCTDAYVRVGVIRHVGLLRAFPFACPIKGSGHVQGIYLQTCPDGWRLGFCCTIYCWNSVAFRTAPISSGWIVPRVAIGRVMFNTLLPFFQATTAYQAFYKQFKKMTSEKKYFKLHNICNTPPSQHNNIGYKT